MSRLERHLDRYADLIPDFPGFVAALGAAPPAHLRVNTLKAEPAAVAAALAAQGVATAPEPWCPVLLRVLADGGQALGTTLLHGLGHVYLQSASSAASALALAAEPGERVLDLCAAPGSKTTLIAQAMADRGCVVANEPSGRRAQSLLANLDRMGVTCAVVTAYSGQNFPLRQRFHRVLVDA
ncbi:MAG: NOL1/NOP2/SUN domain family protein, partial [Deferrisomatales bacterium]